MRPHKSKHSMKNALHMALFGAIWLLIPAAGAMDMNSTPVSAATGNPRNDNSQNEQPRPNPAGGENALNDYRAMFLNGKTASDMAAFIAKHKNADPENLIPRAAIRMRTFAAYEAAYLDHQCDKARQLHRRISGYKVTLPFSYAACLRKKTTQDVDPAALYAAGVRFEADGESASARTLYKNLLDRFPRHPAAKEAEERLARMAEIEALDTAPRQASHPRLAPIPSAPASVALRDPAATDCPKDLGYLRSQMVFAELRQNPNFDEPIAGIILKAGGLEAAITELKRLVHENQRSLSQASRAVRQYKPAGQGDEALAFRCEKPDGGFCSANYYYHLLKEGDFYYTEMLNGLLCRKTGTMEHSRYAPAPLAGAK